MKYLSLISWGAGVGERAMGVAGATIILNFSLSLAPNLEGIRKPEIFTFCSKIVSLSKGMGTLGSSF